MKIHVITISAPELEYAKIGWHEYLRRLKRYYDVRVTHIPLKKNDAQTILKTAGKAYKIALYKNGTQLSSEELASFLQGHILHEKEIVFIIGGPEGLQQEVLDQCPVHISFSRMTFPHDLAMVILMEALYRSATISAGHPYHK